MKLAYEATCVNCARVCGRVEQQANSFIFKPTQWSVIKNYKNKPMLACARCGGKVLFELDVHTYLAA